MISEVVMNNLSGHWTGPDVIANKQVWIGRLVGDTQTWTNTNLQLLWRESGWPFGFIKPVYKNPWGGELSIKNYRIGKI